RTPPMRAERCWSSPTRGPTSSRRCRRSTATSFESSATPWPISWTTSVASPVRAAPPTRCQERTRPGRASALDRTVKGRPEPCDAHLTRTNNQRDGTMADYQLFIDGEYVDAASGETFDTLD